MAKWQDYLNLARFALEGNRDQVINMCRCVIANEPDTSSLKHNLKRLLSRTPSMMALQELLPRDLKGLVLPIEPGMALADTELPVDVQSQLALFLEEQAMTEAIHATGLAVPHKILLSGPPGNGKTTLAGAIAKELNLPLFVVDFSTVVSSYLGESGSKFAKIFRGVVEKPSVLFLDEMETVLSERAGHGNTTEVGEIKRVVSSLLMEIDRLPDHVILIGATNHEEMLDRAVVRRFDFYWELPAPNEDMVQSWLQRFAKRYPNIPILSKMPAIAAEGKSLSDIERDVKKWCRRWIVEQAPKQSGSRREAQRDAGSGSGLLRPDPGMGQLDALDSGLLRPSSNECLHRVPEQPDPGHEPPGPGLQLRGASGQAALCRGCPQAQEQPTEVRTQGSPGTEGTNGRVLDGTVCTWQRLGDVCGL